MGGKREGEGIIEHTCLEYVLSGDRMTGKRDKEMGGKREGGGIFEHTCLEYALAGDRMTGKRGSEMGGKREGEGIFEHTCLTMKAIDTIFAEMIITSIFNEKLFS